jgi:hypothetical protein
LATATAAAPTTAAGAPTTTTGAAAGTPGRAAQHGIRGRAKAMIRGTAEGVENGNNNEGNSDYKEGILRGILSRLLSPEPFEGGQHGNTFDSEGTLGIRFCEETTGNNVPHCSREYKTVRSTVVGSFDTSTRSTAAKKFSRIETHHTAIHGVFRPIVHHFIIHCEGRR